MCPLYSRKLLLWLLLPLGSINDRISMVNRELGTVKDDDTMSINATRTASLSEEEKRNLHFKYFRFRF